MSEQLQSPSKRALFKTAAAVGATLATGSLIACQQQPAASPSNSPASGASNPTPANNDACGGSGRSNVSIPCHGAHQAGIITPDKEQPFGTLCAFDVLAKNTKELENFFRTLTARIEFLTQGGEIAEIDDKLPPPSSGILGKQIPPDGLTITVGVGNSLFDARFGLAKHKPLRLQEMTDFPNDALKAEWCDGDISLQISAFSPETCQNALRDIIKNTSHVATIRWAIDGWAPKTETPMPPPAIYLASATAQATPISATPKSPTPCCGQASPKTAKTNPHGQKTAPTKPYASFANWLNFGTEPRCKSNKTSSGAPNTPPPRWAKNTNTMLPIMPATQTANAFPKTATCA